MKTLSNFLLGSYFLVSILTLFIIILDIFRDLHPISDNIFFFILLPSVILLGIFGGFHSRRNLFIKLIPWFFALLIAFSLGLLYGHTNYGSYFMIVGIVVVLILATIQSSLGGLLTYLYLRSREHLSQI